MEYQRPANPILFNGIVDAESVQSVQSDASDLPSGIYLVRLSGVDFSTSQQITLLK